MLMLEKVIVVFVIIGLSRLKVVSGMLIMLQMKVQNRFWWIFVQVCCEMFSVVGIRCGLLCIRVMLVVCMVMLVLLFMVMLMLVVVSVGVLLMLLLIIVIIWFWFFSLVIVVVLFVGSIFVCMLLMFRVLVIIVVLLWLLLVIRWLWIFCLCRVFIVLVVLFLRLLLKVNRLSMCFFGVSFSSQDRVWFLVFQFVVVFVSVLGLSFCLLSRWWLFRVSW